MGYQLFNIETGGTEKVCNTVNANMVEEVTLVVFALLRIIQFICGTFFILESQSALGW